MRLWIIFLVLIVNISFAQSNNNTKNKLMLLQKKINILEHKLSKVDDKQALVNRELHASDREIAHYALLLKDLNEKLLNKHTQISNLHSKINRLENEYSNNQNILAHYVKALYMVGPLEIMDKNTQSSQSNAISDLQHIAYYYKYLVNQRLSIMKILAFNRALMNEETNDLQHEINKEIDLKRKYKKLQNTLQAKKNYQSAIANALINEYKRSKQELEITLANKQDLENILSRIINNKQISNEGHIKDIKKSKIWPIALYNNSLKTSSVNIKQGVFFKAKDGMPVRAVQSGVVVFSAWLKGYGMLLIIDHGNDLMTLYGHNQALYKNNGDHVAQGEQIAIVGNSGGILQNGLYFEVRHKGKTVPAMQWLKTA